MTPSFILIDTSGDKSFVALQTPESPLDVIYLPSMQQSRTLLPAIQQLMTPHSVQFLGVGVGPGSFTGTRVGVLTAKMLSYSLHLPLVTFCSLTCYIPEQDGPFTIARDAKSKGSYVLNGVKQGTSVSFNDPQLVQERVPPTDLTLNLPALSTLCLHTFNQNDFTPYHDVKVCYLHSP